ncbi:MAG: glycosyltransferase [Candidatus Zixiibacteriota bacterium]
MKTFVGQSLRDLKITVCYRPIQALAGKVHIVTSLLSEAGYRVTQVSNERLHLKKTDILWILDNANWFPIVCKQLQTIPKSERPIIVIWHAEPLPPPKSAGLPHTRLNLREIGKILLRDRRATDVYTNYSRLRALMEDGIPDLLVVSTPARQEFLAEHGLASTFVPLGYHRTEDGYDMGLHRDIEVLFLGALNIPPRKKLFRRLRRSGINLIAKGSWFDPDLWGENRTRLLSRTKIFLNLQRYPGELSGARLIMGMANRTLVISEPMYKPGGFIPGKHFVSATSDEMPEIISYYLNHDDERECIATEGHKLVTGELTMERSISRILELISNHVN